MCRNCIIKPFATVKLIFGYHWDFVHVLTIFDQFYVIFLNSQKVWNQTKVWKLTSLFDVLINYPQVVIGRVAKFACPRVLDDQKMSEDNQKLRSGCPPDYEKFWGKYFENNCPYKFFKDFILTLSFSNKHIILGT